MIETKLNLLSTRKEILTGRLLMVISLMTSNGIVRLSLHLGSAFLVCLLHFLFLWAGILCGAGGMVRGHGWLRFISFQLRNPI